MKTWNTLTFQEKIYEWRQHRDILSELVLSDQIDVTASFFKDLPVSPRTIDFYTPSTWLSPWEIFNQGYFCTSSISLLIYHTLILSNKDINIELAILDDSESVALYPVIDNRLVLNFSPGDVIELSSIPDITVKEIFQKDQIKNYK